MGSSFPPPSSGKAKKTNIRRCRFYFLCALAQVVTAWTLEEKRSEEINATQAESIRLQQDTEVAEPETPPQPPEPLPSQQSLATQPLALRPPPEEVGGNEHEEVMVYTQHGG